MVHIFHSQRALVASSRWGLQVDSFCLCHRGTWLLVSLHFSPRTVFLFAHSFVQEIVRTIFLFIHSFVQEIVHEGLCCVRPCSQSWGLS